MDVAMLVGWPFSQKDRHDVNVKSGIYLDSFASHEHLVGGFDAGEVAEGGEGRVDQGTCIVDQVLLQHLWAYHCRYSVALEMTFGRKD